MNNQQRCIMSTLDELIKKDSDIVRLHHLSAKRLNESIVDIENSIDAIDLLKEELSELQMKHLLSSNSITNLKAAIEGKESEIKQVEGDIKRFTAKMNSSKNYMDLKTCSPSEDDMQAILQKQLSMDLLNILKYSEEGSTAANELEEKDNSILAECFSEDAWKEFRINCCEVEHENN